MAFKNSLVMIRRIRESFDPLPTLKQSLLSAMICPRDGIDCTGESNMPARTRRILHVSLNQTGKAFSSPSGLAREGESPDGLAQRESLALQV
ncbi:hypothetical protein MK280_07925 [Myxococcota bacterium]|nr:hypothetical protein [Myxococcota bacterium]